MSMSWPMKTLGEVCQLRPEKSEARARLSPTAAVSFVPMEDLGINVKWVKALKSRPFSDVAGSYTYFAEGDVLLAKITPCFENGKLGIATDLENGVGFGSSEYFVLRPDATVSAEWLYHYLNRESFRLEGAARMSGAVGHRRVTKEFIEHYPIPVPPLSEQQRIVRLLDEAFEGIAIAKANAEKNLENARALFESYLQSVFTKRGDGWETKKISEIATHSLGKMLDKAKNKGEYQPYLRNLNVRWAEFDLSNVLEMRFLPSEAEKYTVLKGDVLVCEGGYPGRAAIWADDEPIYFQKALHRVRFHEKDRNRWFLYYLIAKDADGTLESYFNGTGIQHFTGEALARFEVPLPPLSEQDELLNRLDKLRETSLELSKAYSAKLTSLDNLKAAFLSVAFSGSLLKAA